MFLADERLGQLHGEVAEGLEEGVGAADQGDLCRWVHPSGRLATSGAPIVTIAFTDQGLHRG